MTQVIGVRDDRQRMEFAPAMSTILWAACAMLATLSVVLLTGPNSGLAAPMMLGSVLFAKLVSGLPPLLHVSGNLLVLVWVVFVLTRAAARASGATVSPVMASSVVLIAGSLGALPFFVALQSADIFAPVLLIVLSALAVFADRLGWLDLGSLIVIGAVGTLLHPSLVAIAWISLPLVAIVSASVQTGGLARAISATLIISIIGAMGMIFSPDDGSGFSVRDLGVVGSLILSDPLMTFSGLMKATLDQANRYDVGAIMTQSVRESAWMGAVSVLHTIVYALSALLAVVLTVLPQQAPPLRVRGCVGMLLGGVLINALVCGLVPDASSQHGARVAFLLPMGLALLMLFFASEHDGEET